MLGGGAGSPDESPSGVTQMLKALGILDLRATFSHDPLSLKVLSKREHLILRP